MSRASEKSTSSAGADFNTSDRPNDDGTEGDGGSILAEPAERGSNSSLLVRLSSDVGDPVIVERFVTDYLNLLDARLDKLRELLASADADTTRLAILSLESSSVMLGADELAGAAGELRHAVMAFRHHSEQPLFSHVVDCADDLKRRLAELGFVSRSSDG